MRTRNFLKYFDLCVGISLTIICGLYIIFEVLGIMGDNRIVRILFAIGVPLLFVILFVTLFYLVLSTSIIQNIQNENLYNFGMKSLFFNYDRFATRARYITRFKRKKRDVYVIGFTPCKHEVSRNSARNDFVTEFNGKISIFVQDFFKYNKDFPLNEVSYCYYHGIFLLYVFGNEEEIRKLVNDLEDGIYNVQSENSIRVETQPYFGIVKKSDDIELYQAVDNALTARNFSELNFEQKTFFNDTHKKAVDVDEINELKEALENNEFVVYYQPKFNLLTKRFVSSEALIRWDSPKYGLVTPAKFIDKAELGGLIHEIDMYVLKTVCKELAETKAKGRRLIPVSVNFSMYEFYGRNFINEVLEVIENYKINPSLIEIEVTEATSQANTFYSQSILKKLRENGIRVLMDDFGIGFSNVENLLSMPFDCVKIDKSFIQSIATDLKSKEVVKFLISLSKVNGLEVVAEGVDNEIQVDLLRRLKCDTIQGYYYSKPLKKSDFDKFLRENEFERKENV